jgi:hypothetical protein
VSGARPRAVLVEEDAGEELLSRGDAEALVEVLDVVLDAVTLSLDPPGCADGSVRW